jgi:hypothetical protein
MTLESDYHVTNLSTRYGTMILEALSELNEPNGSEVRAIQGFIEVGISKHSSF